jgi:hypothetical protein
MLNVVSFKPPKFKPLPGELTPAVINGATLPVKVEAAKRAIAACCDLSELLTWKDKLAALAAAAKIARMPEMARDVNRVHKEAIFRMGEILLTYKAHLGIKITRDKNGKIFKTNMISDRGRVAESLGISKCDRTGAVRLASAPIQFKESVLADDKLPPVPRIMANRVPVHRPTKRASSDAALIVISGKDSFGRNISGGLLPALGKLKNTSLERIAELTLMEKQRARKLVVEMQEILDEIDRRLGPNNC